ncbi:nitronate monooxygenase [Bacillus cabrialesii]|nr:nitronate monooxygenase [Bacillus cabrialesii]UQE78214.1 nitronate monooxygenase [Bacillus cabrialesii]
MKEQQAEEENALPYPLRNTFTKPMRKHAAGEKDPDTCLYAETGIDVTTLLAELFRT